MKRFPYALLLLSASIIFGITTSQAQKIDAGRIFSSLDVSATGAAVYTVPIILPPGLGKSVPELALNYNSQGGNGLAGYGWNLSGLSSISRVPATVFHDGRVGSVNINDQDRFALDGQRLLLKSGTYGADGAEYQTENYSNVRIIGRGYSLAASAYFEVLFPDGSKAVYGNTPNSQTATEYAISYSESPLGARINYSYQLSDGVLYITEIGYGSLGSAASLNRVTFNYLLSNRVEHVYNAGVPAYKGMILNQVSVMANGSRFRNYKLSYSDMATLNYSRLTSIQEFDGSETKALPPIYFYYRSTSDAMPVNTISNLSLSGIASNNSGVMTADFTGNGSMDFMLYPTAKDKVYAFYDLESGASPLNLGFQINTGKFRDIFPATWLSQNSKIMPGQGMLLVKDNGINAYKFEMYSAGTVTPVYYQYERELNNLPMSPGYFSDYYQQNVPGVPLFMEFISGDFNGDGLSDVIGLNDGNTVVGESVEYYQDPYDDRASYYYTVDQFGDVGSTAYFINMDRRLTANYVTNLGKLGQSYYAYDKLYTGDLNGDGKTDILHVKERFMYVYTLNQNNTLELLWQIEDNRITNSQPALVGDYNGDGKMDVMFSTGNNSFFATFLSTGKAFVKQEHVQPFSNTASSWDGTNQNLFFLIPNDIDGDGKTDLISAQTTTQNNNNRGTVNITVYHNLGPKSASSTAAGQSVFGPGISGSTYTNLKHNPIPIFLNPTRPNHNLEFGFMSDNSISLFKFQKDFRKEAQISYVYQDGVNHTIEYKNLTTNASAHEPPFYQSGYDQTYPFVDLHNVPGLSVVSKVTKYFGEDSGLQEIVQEFGYANAVSHTGGLGFLGFGELWRSNWNLGNNDVNRNFTISIQDPQLRGANVRSFITKSPYLNPSVKNTALTSPPSASGIADNASLSDYISRSDQAYLTQLLPNKVFVNIPAATATKNMLSGTFSTQSIAYDAYYNNTKSTSNFNGSGTKTLEVTYDNNPSAGYIGRPLTTQTTLNNGSDSFSSREEYTYTGFLPTQVKRRGNGTTWITDDLIYDAFGNIRKKTVTAPDGIARTISMEYDVSGRFITKNIDVEGLSTSFTYDPSTGNLLTKTNPYSQTETYEYDSWGRQAKMTDHLNVSSNRIYQKFSYETHIVESDDEGHQKTSIINRIGQNIETRERNVMGLTNGKASQYDAYGRQIAESEINQPGSYNQWNTTEYDEYGRPKRTTSFTGKTTSFSYDGLSTTVSDGTKSVTTTKNALDQILSLKDPGGTINYTYFANGNLKMSDYGGIAQTIEQDGWGRKTKLTDPSAGVYQYEYDGFGQPTKEINPKGTTRYNYAATGKLQSKKITGDDTNMEYAYTYDPNTKLLTTMDLTNSDGNNTVYRYAYDNQKRLSSTEEDNLHARFVKNYTYDSYGRIATEGYQATNKLNQTSASKTIEMYYSYGELLGTTLQGGSQDIFSLYDINAKGSITATMHGTTLKTSLNYDTYGFPEQNTLENVSGNPVTLMKLGYGFDGQRGTLNTRSNSAFNWSESFSYDNLDRLTNFNDNNGNNSQAYDNRGRITTNSQLGNYSYDGNTYKQRELDLNPNPAANAYYQARSLQQISFNSFKSPVEINEQGKERISFQYNGTLERSHMYYGDEQADKMLRRYRRHYAEDGSMEITNDIQTGKTSFTFYLGGDAYSAPAIWKEVHQGGQSSQNLYFLHRDHLNSIVMITNEQGGVVEKRQFDAWGNLVKLQDGAGNDLVAFVISDRGYTGHEHLAGVGLIHMNGRLYDSKLHRFLSPDNYVQDPFNSQNYNQYGYAMNNPLMYTDPSGEIFWLIPALIFVAKAAVIGAAIGAVSYTAGVALSNGGFNNWNWGQFGKSIGIGAISGVVTAGIGSAFGAAGNFGHEMLRGLAHGVAQGGLSELSGGNFLTGLATGGLGSLAGSGWQAWGGNFANSGVGTVAFAAVSGGIGAELTGGDFWEGAGTGAIIAGLNHLHEHVKKRFYNARLKKMYDVYKNSVVDYGKAADFYESIGGPLGEWAAKSPKEFENTCAARLSKALNYGGFEIPNGTPATYLGGDNKSYFINAKAMSIYLSKGKVWGAPRSISYYKSLKNAVFYQTGFDGGVTGHLDIIYNGKPAHEIYPNPTKYWH